MEGTSNPPDLHSEFFNNDRKPDITVYSDPPPSNDNSCDIESFLELKPDLDSDGFEVLRGESNQVLSVEKDTFVGRDTRGQLVTYLNATHASQYRTHSFGILILASQCRFRLTRSRIEVTQRFDYTSSRNSHLQTFFWRLSHATCAASGIDETFEANLSIRFRQKFLNAHGKPIYKVRVGECSFYVSSLPTEIAI